MKKIITFALLTFLTFGFVFAQNQGDASGNRDTRDE